MKQRPIETFLSRNSTVSSGAYFAPPHILDFIKKCCTNNSLLSRYKTISSLLVLADHVLSISEYILIFDEKLTQNVAQTSLC